MADETCNVQRLKSLGLNTYDKIKADPRYSKCAANIYPLTGKIGNVRTTKKVLGEGTYGRVNLEEVEKKGLVAAKYFTSDETLCENSTEIATLQYLKGLPNVAQLIRVVSKPAGAAARAPNLSFPAAIMGKAVGAVSDRTLYTSWNDLYSTIKQVLKGYYTLYTQGIAHRDTKPANMLITATKEVWITDFGMARYIGEDMSYPDDIYTGSYYYAAPELLLRRELNKHEEVDFFISDAWAVGASIYEILTGQFLYSGATKHDIIDHIFRVKGTPIASDGDIYTLYLEYKAAKQYNDIFPRDVNALKWRIENRAAFKPADPTVLQGIIEIVSGLLTYDPTKRMTIAEALQKPVMGGKLPDLPAPKSLVPFYLKTGPLPEDLSSGMLDILFDWLLEVVHYARYELSPTSKGIVMDRAGAYTMMFLYKYRENPYMKRANLQLVASVALHLAVCFFDVSYDATIVPDDIIDVTSKSYTKPEIMECIKMFMLADIPLFGPTFLDTILSTLPELTDEQSQTISLLNYICYQKNLFPATEADLTKLSDVILEFAAEVSKFGSFDFIQKKYKTGAGNKTKPKVAAFAAAVRAKYAATPAVTPAAEEEEEEEDEEEEANAVSNAKMVRSTASAAPKPKPGSFVTVAAINLPSEGGRRRRRTRRNPKKNRSTRRHKKQ